MASTPKTRLSAGLGGLPRLLVAVGMTLGSAGIAATLGIDAGPAGATARAAVAKPDVVSPSPAAPKTTRAQAQKSFGKSYAGKKAPKVSLTPDVPAPTPGSTLTVDTTTDAGLQTPGSTTCVASTATGRCTLRAAVEAADNNIGRVDTINAPAGTYVLSTGPGLGALDITNSMLIVGPASGGAVVDGQSKVEDLCLSIPDDDTCEAPTTTGHTVTTTTTDVGTTVALPAIADEAEPAVEVSGLTLENGSSPEGGDIYAREVALTLSGTTVTGGSAVTGGGIDLEDGALWTDGSTTITSNAAEEAGGGLYSDYSAVVIGGSTLNDNSADAGGAVYQDGALVSQGVTYDDDSSPHGGAIYNDFTMTDSGSTYRGTTAKSEGDDTETRDVYGGVIDNVEDAAITDATITDTSTTLSTAALYGAVFYNDDQLTLDDVSVSGTSSPCSTCDIYGGVAYSEVEDDETGEGALNVTGLAVSDTSNGGSSANPYIVGGVIDNTDSHGTLHGFSASQTADVTSTDGIIGAVLYAGNWSEMTAVAVSGTTVAASGDSGVEGTVYLDTDTSVTGLSVSNTAVTDGADSQTYGAALLDEGTGALDDVTLSGTSVTQLGGDLYGGALYTESDGTNSIGDLSITGTTVKDIGTDGGEPDGYVLGGGWYNTGDVTANDDQVLDTSVTANDQVFGGGLASEYGDPTLTDSTVAGVTVTGSGQGTVYGGVAAFDSLASLVNVTLDDGTVTVTPTVPGSLVFVGTDEQFSNDTIANDTIQTSTGAGLSASEGGLLIEGPAYFKNTIVATNPAGANCLATAVVTSTGGNLDSGSSCGFTQATDQQNTYPKVATAAANGGPVETAALEPGSPALGKGVSAGCPATDARGVVRPAGDCDVGAFQKSDQGYWEVASDGGMFAFGTARFYGSMGSTPLVAPVVGMASTPDQGGYWEVAADGGIFAFGDATFYGSMGGIRLNQPVVAIADTPSGKGYWEVAADGGVFSFGNATFYGSMGGVHLNAPVVGIAATPTGKGYWEVAADGGIFAFGNAVFYGSMGGVHLNAPVVDIIAMPTGRGYWEVAADGGLFAFGRAQFYGSMGGVHLNAPVVAGSDTPDGQGYWEFAADGGLFAFGDAGFYGSMGGKPLNAPIVGGEGFERL